MITKLKYFLIRLIHCIPIEKLLPSDNFSITANGDKIYYDATLDFHYDLNSDIGKSLYWSKKFEEFEISFFKQMIDKKRYDVIIDIGANIGWNSVRWLRDSAISKIFLFEPSRSTREILTKNVKNIDSTRYQIEPYAVYNEDKFLQFFHCKDNAYSSLKNTNRKQVIETYDVKSTTLDYYFGDRVELQSGKVLIKIDVEGFENDVIMGGTKLISELKPDLFIEIFQGENSNSQPNFIFEYMLPLGYSIFAFANKTLLPVKQYNPNYYNYYFTISSS